MNGAVRCAIRRPGALDAGFPPTGWRFLGGLANPDDVTQYLAAMWRWEQALGNFDPAAAFYLRAIYRVEAEQ